jgi:hypothetical protein
LEREVVGKLASRLLDGRETISVSVDWRKPSHKDATTHFEGQLLASPVIRTGFTLLG